MRAAPPPRLHLFVCANRREGSPLGPGCAERGDAVYDALKHEVGARRKVAEIWVTKTHCLGICPKRGATVARYGGSGGAIVADVEVGDVEALLASASASEETRAPGTGTGTGTGTAETAEGTDDFARTGEIAKVWDDIEKLLVDIEELQTRKVLDLARRLKPGLTMEDVQNPHDFPELDDPDWHYADGILTGMKSVTSAMRALRQRARSAGDEG